MTSDVEQLAELIKITGDKYGCDKVNPHAYHQYYARHLVGYLDTPIKILEIGVGGEGNSLGGASLKMWADIFPKAKIFGWDIYPKTHVDNERIQTFLIDQSDVQSIVRFVEEFGPFDMIVDDGSHFSHHQLTSLFNLFEAVKPGGLYVIEDYFTSYWPLYGGSSILTEFLDTPVRWIKKMVDIINRNNLVVDTLKPTIPDWNVEELHVYPGLAVVKKAFAEIPSKIPDKTFLDNQENLDVLRYGSYSEVVLNHAIDPMLHLNDLQKHDNKHIE